MEKDLYVTANVIIPHNELEITASRSGGPGGQHVNKTSSRITVRWNIPTSTALTAEQKELLLQKLHAQVTTEGDLLISTSASRSQHQNKEIALTQLAHTIQNALYIPKKRMKTRVSRAKKEARLQTKTQRGVVKKLRRVTFNNGD